MSPNPLRQPEALGQSVWLDFLENLMVQVPGTVRYEAVAVLSELARRSADAEIDWHAIARQLEDDGIRKFVGPHEAILASLRSSIALQG